MLYFLQKLNYQNERAMYIIRSILIVCAGF